jgi:hypothetical protein
MIKYQRDLLFDLAFEAVIKVLRNTGFETSCLPVISLYFTKYVAGFSVQYVC